jgi:hypothetical protein
MAAETQTFPGSSNVASATYDRDTQIMRVEFNNGSQYEAGSVPASMWDGLSRSPSPGSFYHRHLKGQFGWSQV